MTCEKQTVTRSNFASRLLTKAMSERKTVELPKPTVSVSQTDFSPPIGSQIKEPVGAK